MKTAEIAIGDVLPGRARGSNVGTSKLTEAKVIQIRRLREQGAGVRKLADAFGVSPATVRSVVGRRTWGHIPQ